MEETLNNHRNPVAGTKLIVGLFFAAVGVLMTADNLDLFDAWKILRWWPAVILLVGVIKLADPGRRLAGVILTVFGVLLLAASLEWWWRFSIFDLWPLLLIGAGAAMVARALGVRAGVGVAREGGGDIVAILGVRKEAPREFNGARVAAVMGGVELDLSEANLAQSPAIIECFAIWGGIEIRVPDGWEVVGELVPIMGGFEVSTAPAADPQKQLIVRGLALMGGVDVKRRKQ
jgi:Domain of unknown function (DUF5668)/Cell wall-active antibiotics response 4TMS YvqF